MRSVPLQLNVLHDGNLLLSSGLRPESLRAISRLAQARSSVKKKLAIMPESAHDVGCSAARVVLYMKGLGLDGHMPIEDGVQCVVREVIWLW